MDAPSRSPRRSRRGPALLDARQQPSWTAHEDIAGVLCHRREAVEGQEAMDQAGAGQVACVDVQVAQMINQRCAFVAQRIVLGSGDQSRRQGRRRAHEAPRAVVLDSVETAGPGIPAGYQYAVRAPTTMVGRRDAIAAHAPVRGPALRCPAVVFGSWQTTPIVTGSPGPRSRRFSQMLVTTSVTA